MLDSHYSEELQNFLSEIEILKRVGHHEHVITFIGSSGSKRPPYLIMELAENGNLRDFLRSKNVTAHKDYISMEVNGGIDVQSQIRFAKQVSSGMVFIASINVSPQDVVRLKSFVIVWKCSVFTEIWPLEMFW